MAQEEKHCLEGKIKKHLLGKQKKVSEVTLDDGRGEGGMAESR